MIKVKGSRWGCNMEGIAMRSLLRAAWWNLTAVGVSEEGSQLSGKFPVSVLLAYQGPQQKKENSLQMKQSLPTQFPRSTNSVTRPTELVCLLPVAMIGWY